MAIRVEIFGAETSIRSRDLIWGYMWVVTLTLVSFASFGLITSIEFDTIVGRFWV